MAAKNKPPAKKPAKRPAKKKVTPAKKKAKRGRGEAKTSPRLIAAAKKRLRALELRKAGANYQSIAQQLGYAGPSGAYNAVATALKEIPAAAVEELRQMESERLDAMQIQLWRSALAGDRAAVEQVLRIMARRARLLGLDLPATLDVTSGGERLEFTLKISNGAGDENPPED